MSKYIPDVGDIVWIILDPQSGKEPKKTRPALVLSPKKYNKAVGLFIICPITSQIKNYPFEVRVTIKSTASVILADHVKSLDWKARKAKFITKAPFKVIDETKEKLAALIIH